MTTDSDRIILFAERVSMLAFLLMIFAANDAGGRCVAMFGAMVILKIHDSYLTLFDGDNR